MKSLLSISVALAARAMSFFVDAGVRFCELVALFTMGLSRAASPPILNRGYRFQVSGVRAGSIAAHVINLMSFRDCVNMVLVRVLMRAVQFPAIATYGLKQSVSA